MEKEQFYNQLEQNLNPVVVDVWAPRCMPCRAIAPVLDKLGEAYSGCVDVWKVNADESADLVRALGVRGIPTLIAYRDGQEVARRVGAAPQGVLESLFKSALADDMLARSEPSQSRPNRSATVRRGLSSMDRLLRLAVGAALLLLGWNLGPSLLLMAVAGVVLFSAVYDRCPVWQTIAPRLAQWLRLPSSTRGGS